MTTTPRLPSPTRFQDACAKFLYFLAFIKSASAQTIRSYRNDLAQAFDLDSNDLDPCSSGPPPRFDADQLLAACREAQTRWVGLSAASRNRKAACLKSFLNWLHDEEAIDRELAHQIFAPKVPLRLPHFISVDEVQALLQSLTHDLAHAPTSALEESARRDLALILLLYGGGLRVSEACTLEWTQLDMTQQLVRVLGKGRKERLVALPPITIAALARLLPAQGKFVFGSEPLDTRVAYGIVRSRGARAGLLKPLHPHALRHSYATHLLASGANLRTLQELLGHATLQATSRYTHLGIDQLANTLETCHPLGEKARKNVKSS